jgi:hypothetical protein
VPLLALILGGGAMASSRSPARDTRVGHTSFATAPITIGQVTGDFYPNPGNGGSFDSSQLSSEVFQQQFPVVDFNPPTSAQVSCSNSTGVDENTRPFTDVVPNPDGTCSTLVAQGNGQQAGCSLSSPPPCAPNTSNLVQFEAAFGATLTVAAAGQVTFNFFSDDGWILGIGQQVGGSAQPTYVSGSLYNAPATSPLHGYLVVGAYNTNTAPVQQQVTVNFPNAGTYPIEVDYTECCGGQLSLVLGTTFSNPIPPSAPPCTSKVRPSTASGYTDAIRGLYRLGDDNKTVAPNSSKGSGKFAALGGVYADILNCSPWVEPGGSTGTSAWVMLQEFGHGDFHMQIGWTENTDGQRAMLVALEDGVTNVKAAIDAIIGQGSLYKEERCDNAQSLAFMSCVSSIPVPAVGTSTYYTVEFHPSKPVKQDYILSFDVSGLLAILQTQSALDNDSVLQSTDTKCKAKVTSPLIGPPTGHFTCTMKFTMYGTFAMFMQQSGEQRVQVATAPARFLPNQANVAGEIHSPYSQMPGTSASHEVFDDAHVYSDGSWVNFDGQELFNGQPFDNPGPWTLTATAGDPRAPTGQRVDLWDNRVG